MKLRLRQVCTHNETNVQAIIININLIVVLVFTMSKQFSLPINYDVDTLENQMADCLHRYVYYASYACHYLAHVIFVLCLVNY